MEFNRNKKQTVKINFCTQKEYTKTSGHASNAAVTISNVVITCRYLPIFLWCGAVPIMGFRENIASLVLIPTEITRDRVH